MCFHGDSRFVRGLSRALLCFHRHSRFVPSNSSREVESRESKGDKQSASYRLTSWFGFATPRLLDSSTPRLFVFIDILALFRRIRVEKSRVESRRVTSSRHPPSTSCFGSTTPRLLDSSTPRLFVFIDILALFPRFCSREVEESRRWGALRHLPACGPRATVAVGSGSHTPRLFDSSTSRLHLDAETTGRNYG
jgi:hypothetical protein